MTGVGRTTTSACVELEICYGKKFPNRDISNHKPQDYIFDREHSSRGPRNYFDDGSDDSDIS